MPASVTTLDLGVSCLLVVWGLITVLLVKRAKCRSPDEVEGASSPPPEATLKEGFSAKDVFDRRKAQLDDDKRRLERNIALLATMLAIAICMAVAAAKRTDMSLLGVNVPFNALVILVPSMLVYLWGRFGFLLHQSIENRHALMDVIEEMEPAGRGIHWSLEPLLRDHGFVDSYIYWDRPKKREATPPAGPDGGAPPEAGDCGEPGKKEVSRSVDQKDSSKDYIPLFAYLFFMASVHAAIFGTLWNGIGFWDGTAGGYLAKGCLVLFAVLISYTHFKFASYRNAHQLQYGVIIAAVLLTPVFPLLARA